MTNEKNYGKFIETYRKYKRVSQVELARTMGCSSQYVNNTEKSDTTSLEVLKKFIRAINQTVNNSLDKSIENEAKKLLKS